jgi:hypothetical protein
MAQITASLEEVEAVVQAFAHKDISGLTFVLTDGKVSLQNINLEGDAEFKGLAVGYAVKLSTERGMNAVVTLK